MRILALIFILISTTAQANDYYNASGAPTVGSSLDSSVIRTEYGLIEDGFDKLPDFTGNAGEVVVVNAGETAMESITKAALATAAGYELSANKNASGGYVGLSTYDILFKDTTGTYSSKLTNSNSAIRTYTFPDESGTIELDSHTHATTTENRIINSEMMIDQYNAGAATTTTDSFTVDRFSKAWANTDELAISAVQSTGIGDYRNSIKITATTPETAWATDEYVIPIRYKFLGYDVADLVNGEDVTISFYFKSNHPDASVFSVALVAGDSGYSYVTDFTYTTSATEQLVTKTITIPAHASSYISNTTTGAGLMLYIGAVSGADFQRTTGDAWDNANYMSSASATDWTQAVAGPTDGYIQVSGVSFHVASAYVPLQKKSYDEYLEECLPYAWEVCIETAVSNYMSPYIGRAATTSVSHFFIPFPKPMINPGNVTVSSASHFSVITGETTETAATAVALVGGPVARQYGALLKVTTAATLTAGDSVGLGITNLASSLLFTGEI